MTIRIPHQEEAINGNENVEVYARAHEKHSSNHFFAFLNALQSLNLKGRFLEIGSGPGFLTTMVAEKSPQSTIVALEPSMEMITFATSHTRKRKLESRIEFVQGSVDDDKQMSKLGEFDLVYSTFSLHHWTNPLKAWKLIFNAVKPKGTVLIHDLKRVSWLYHLPFHTGLFNSVRAAYNAKEIATMLTSAQIHDFQIKTPFPYFWMTIIAKNQQRAA